MTDAPIELSIVTLVNHDGLYAQCRSALEVGCADTAVEHIPVRADAEGWNAAQGLNHGLEQACGRWIACVHQDVIVPPGWWARVTAQLDAWADRHGRYPGVAGLVGTTPTGSYRGSVHDPMGFRAWSRRPARVACLDEHVILIRADAGLRFDPANPGFHCYGTDIALEARRRGADVIALDAPVTHLSAGRIDESFDAAAQWLLSKWGAACGGVIPTCARTIVAPDAALRPRRFVVSLAKRASGRRDAVSSLFRTVPEPFRVSLSEAA